MRFWKVALLASLAIGCSSVEECFQATGELRTAVYAIEPFEDLIINPRVQVLLEQGENYRLEVQAGENLFDQIRYEIANGQLKLYDENNCNFNRAYGTTVVKVVAPDIKSIHNYSAQTVRNVDTLHFPSLRLYGIDATGQNVNAGVGDFDLVVAADYISAESNFVSQFKVAGRTHTLYIGMYHGMSRFEGAALHTNNAVVFHRGSNDLTVRVSDTLRAELRSTGDLISKMPTLYKEIDRTYTGQFIENYD